MDPEKKRLEKARNTARTPVFLPESDSIGVGSFTPSNDINSFKLIFHMIVSNTEGVTWGEGEDQDPRQRMYGFLPNQRDALIESGIRIKKEGSEGDEEHLKVLQSGSVDIWFHQPSCKEIKDLPGRRLIYFKPPLYQALESITKEVQWLVPERYKKFAIMDELVAIQPNLHNGADYLPAHLDFPRHDGFGIIIVTIGTECSGVVVLIDDGDDGEKQRTYSFHVNEGDAYVLCGDARNKCVHGIIATGSPRRTTLNLRYGLHSEDFARTEVDQHWPE